ncbi:uncharacterized protein RMCC_2720 [Mycolicibacterium canariasense]|uniref:Uncharacterized protein n=1 Tax=Mycolicibacterium canariasense TaxID=228230 RepID=A0A100WD38_MYCCR|nr:hypothetical protein [Mycolicibacterium canariasense]MCV7207043.1 hypothetical protein [Mycolicibacterium canariasense]ORV05617.1 hypothetical protein AWB94_19745 [Mycolicibacterium canariasense]GAS95754.1 uncharacterized protein RMCC_2720 [Mycolicibacterium canariasense]
MAETIDDPASITPSTWAGRKAALKSRHVGDDDPRVVECDEQLALHRVSRVIAAEAAHLTRPAVDRLVASLQQAVAS